jgi:hypothetical protein
MAASIKMAVFWDVSCSQVELYVFIIRVIAIFALMMEASKHL